MWTTFKIILYLGFSGCTSGKKNPSANAGDIRNIGSVPGSGRCPGEGNGNPLQYSCLENPMDRGDWQATVHQAPFVFIDSLILGHRTYRFLKY